MDREEEGIPPVPLAARPQQPRAQQRSMDPEERDRITRPREVFERESRVAIIARVQDLALPAGTRLRVQGHASDGVYERWQRRTFGANAHFIDFGAAGGGVQQVALKGLSRSQWSVVGAVVGGRWSGAEKIGGEMERAEAVVEPDGSTTGCITVHVQQLTGSKHTFEIPPDTSMGDFKRTLHQEHDGPTPDGMKLLRSNVDGTPGDPFDEDEEQSVADAGMVDGAMVHMTMQDDVAGKARREARVQRARDRARKLAAKPAGLVRQVSASRPARQIRQAAPGSFCDSDECVERGPRYCCRCCCFGLFILSGFIWFPWLICMYVPVCRCLSWRVCVRCIEY
jgi:hypothetical protein